MPNVLLLELLNVLQLLMLFQDKPVLPDIHSLSLLVHVLNVQKELLLVLQRPLPLPAFLDLLPMPEDVSNVYLEHLLVMPQFMEIV